MNQFARQLMGGVGGAEVNPMFLPRGVGSADVQPMYVGAPAVAQAQMQGQVVNYSGIQYVAGELSYFGMGSILIPAGSTGVQTAPLLPSRPITPQRLGCPSNVQGLLIQAASIGGINLFASQLGVPIEMFSEVSTFPQMNWPTLEPSTGIQFTLANPTLTDLLFKPVFYGTQVRR